METVVIGPQPPPLGGISVYLYRLGNRARSDRFIDEKKMGKLDWLKLMLLRGKHVIYHSPSLKRRLFIFAMSYLNGGTFTLVIHGDSLKIQFGGATRMGRWLIRKMLRKAASLQVVNAGIKDFIIGVSGVPGENIEVISTFLPPPPEDEAGILATYGAETKTFIDSRSPLIIANAHQLRFHEGVDLYGLDLCLRLIADLKHRISDRVGLVFALAQAGNVEYFRRMRAFVEELGIEDNVHFLTGQKEIWPLFKSAHLMVRPTCTDGFGISVAEALHFGCPAVASDVCARAEGTVLFANRDYEDFRDKCIGVLEARGK